MKNNFRLNRIARAIAAAGFLQNIDSDFLDYCKEVMKRESEGLFDIPPVIHANSGNSYDGYMSFTEGDVSCAFPMIGWDLAESMPDKFSEEEECCKECFLYDEKSLLEENGYEINSMTVKELVNDLDFQGGDTPQEIVDAFNRYEEKWMGGDILCYAVVEVQFHNDGNGAENENYNVSVYSYTADEYMKHKDYLYEDSFNMGEGNPYALIEDSVKKAFKSIA